MKITFDQMSQIDKNTTAGRQGTEIRRVAQASSYPVNVAFDGKERVGFGTQPGGKKKGNIPEMVDSAEIQVQNMRNQMTVLSHTMSDEDFAKMSREGFDPSEMDPEEAVTILDKIKAELLKAGEHIAGFTDNMDMTTLAAAVGSTSLAADLAESFSAQDIPLDKQNVEQVLWALDIAKQVKAPTDSSYYYMAANGMEATLKDFYLAGASGSMPGQEQSNPYFAEDVDGYITKNVSDGSDSLLSLEQEIEKLLKKLELPTDEESRELAAWLVEKGLPIDAGHMKRMQDIFAVPFPLQPKQVVETAVAAIAEGIPVGEKSLTETGTYLSKAVELFEWYQGEEGMTLVQDRLKLEEVRLHMTVEANVKLLKSGFSIDTAPIEETIEALKQAEAELAKEYFPHAEQPLASYALYKETGNVLKQLPQLPLDTVGRMAFRMQEVTLQQFHEEGVELASAYKAAGERYEAIWTAPRADLGDSLKKAFANVDEILKDLNYEATEENRKAIRTLGYNRMEINSENMQRVKEAQHSVDAVIRRMTPAATLKMIRDGINPLESTPEQLNQYFDTLPEEFSQEAEKYSKFLYRLQKQGDITPQEREAFIGCYRLLNQLEKSDGAAVGALVNIGGELNFRNLLSAIRTGRFKSMDVQVNDMVGALSEETVMKFSISEQIAKGFEREQANTTRKQLEEGATAPKESFHMLERGEMPATAQNLVAAKLLEQEASTLLEGLLRRSSDRQGREELRRKLEKKKEFGEAYEKELEESIQQIEAETLQEAQTTLDVRERKLIHKQLHIMQKLSPQEEFFFPMEIGGKVTGVHLQFTHSETMQGQIHMTLESMEWGRISGRLQVTEKGVEGYFVGNQRETVMKLRASSDIINSSIRKEWTFCEIEFIYSEANDIPMDWTRRSADVQVSNERLYSLSKEFLQAVKAVGEA